MIDSWRWFGLFDQTALPKIAQAGASRIVTALRELPCGVVRPLDSLRHWRAQDDRWDIKVALKGIGHGIPGWTSH